MQSRIALHRRFAGDPTRAAEGEFSGFFRNLFEDANRYACFSRTYDQVRLTAQSLHNVASVMMLADDVHRGEPNILRLRSSSQTPKVELEATGLRGCSNSSSLHSALGYPSLWICRHVNFRSFAKREVRYPCARMGGFRRRSGLSLAVVNASSPPEARIGILSETEGIRQPPTFAIIATAAGPRVVVDQSFGQELTIIRSKPQPAEAPLRRSLFTRPVRRVCPPPFASKAPRPRGR
jgi:hypothetical protein